MTHTFWLEGTIFFIAALIGGGLILPYSIQLLKLSNTDKPLTMTMGKLLALSLVQNAIISAVIILVGLLAAHALGHGAPYIEALLLHTSLAGLGRSLTYAILFGIAVGVVFLLFDFLLIQFLPKPLIDTTRTTTALQNLAASFYGGINEELLVRLFGLSGIAWILTKIWHSQNGNITAPQGTWHAANIIFWTANIIMAILFGLGHLPTTKKLTGRITPFLLFRALFLNGIIGIICGWLFWHYGLEAAMLAHFSADIIYHVGGTFVIRQYDRYN